MPFQKFVCLIVLVGFVHVILFKLLLDCYNEIVYNNNSRLYRQTDKDRLMAYMRRLDQTLEEAVVSLGYH